MPRFEPVTSAVGLAGSIEGASADCNPVVKIKNINSPLNVTPINFTSFHGVE